MDQGLSRHRGFIFLVGYKHQANKETFNLMVKQKHKIKKNGAVNQHGWPFELNS